MVSRKQLPLPTIVRNWLADRKATRTVHDINEKYSARVTDAENAGDREAYDLALHEWQVDADFVLHPIYARKAEKITAEARKFGITVPPKPRHGGEESDDWYLSRETGDWLLAQELEQRLRREIKIERRASYDEFRKWTTLIFALLGFALGFYSLRIKQNQPDPCPKNYYRDDAGRCVFALHTSPP